VTTTAKHYTPASRDAEDIYLLILHSTSGTGTAEQLRQYFAAGERQVSAHYIVDAKGAVATSVEPKDIAWHAGNWDTNRRSIGIELVGVAGQSVFPKAQLDGLVRLMARLSDKYNLSLRRVYDYNDGRIYLPFGVAQHANVWGGNHTDISPRFAIRDICAHARDYRNKQYGIPVAEWA
jgi:N-acetyl-anhydromuramyl-L-alanine amidase AmpD